MENSKLLYEKFEEYLQNNLQSVKSFHPHFENALTQMLKAGGKRFRPLLLLNVVVSYEPMLIDNSLPIALALEMLHTYSLIHDDLPTFDDAPLRRGHPTLHESYDEVTATLVGDALNSDSFYVISKAPLSSDTKIKLVEELAKGGGSRGMVIGQAIDCYFENKKLSIDELIFLHTHKTAKLIATSLKMGAIIVDLDKKTQDLLYDIGLKMGLLFQVEDDIIDATKSSLEVGKPTNHDGEKNSFTNLLGVDGAIREKKRLINELEVDIEKVDTKLRVRLQKMIDKYFK